MIVIADDITGAAEMAGIAHSHGLRVRMVCAVVGNASKLDVTATLGSVAHYTDVLVIATDTRSMTEAEATEETCRIISYLSPLTSHLFKKTDSALRGHVIAELKALMSATGYKQAVYLPANPSKGRIIKDGVYYIKKEERLTPLHETAFSYDPEFPARTAVLHERFPNAEAAGIIMPDAETADDIRSILTRYNDGATLFAGAADLFKELLQSLEPKSTNCAPPYRKGLLDVGLLLCGSTQSNPQAIGLPESPMPLGIYDGSNDLQPWLADARPKYEKEGALMLTIPHHHRTGRDTAVHLRQMMARMARQLFSPTRCSVGGGNSVVQPHHLVIEGGATAWATFQALGWTHFDMLQELAPGVVTMRATDGTIVTLKPGSYPWGHLFNETEQPEYLSKNKSND